MEEKPSSGKPSYIGRYGGLSVPGTRAGAIVSIGLVVLAWIAIPLARPFILGTVGLGLLVGLSLWWRHNKPPQE
ncbi:MAG TPA: hypothetical protein VNY81_03620 [Candidatus Saccharimonadales bacterium]|jgi:hypothetical protein|nr:hypothetical protein [Candidatus Saccharimonadales bacterium]